jgi:signal transduction histidine kinase
MVRISVRHRVEADAVECQVADTGIGIPREKLDSIFDMFLQVDSSATRKYGGVGLGLYIVKKFTELLGGRVAVESEVGKGSIFTVTLPISPVRDHATPSSPASSQGAPAAFTEESSSKPSEPVFATR